MSGELLAALPPVRGALSRRAAARAAHLAARRRPGRGRVPAGRCRRPRGASSRASRRTSPVTPIGVASNLLVRDGGHRRRRACASAARSPRSRSRTTALRVGAGATDRMIAIQAAKAGLSGLEFLIGIPGTLGGAVRMNAGAFGGETAEVVERVVALDPDGPAPRARRRRRSASATATRRCRRAGS